MNNIYITGDIHGTLDIKKLGSSFTPLNCDSSDYVIILGDFGLLWTPYPSREEKKWLNWFDDQPWTTLVVDGNHENHERFAALRSVDKFKSTVGQISKKIFHLRRGHVYTIHGKTFFTMGGARSIDQNSRVEGVSWWRGEIPSFAEFDLGLQNLEARDWKVDYILSHTGPTGAIAEYLFSIGVFNNQYALIDPVSKYLDTICEQTQFKRLFYGHMHDDYLNKDKKYHLLYDHIILLGEEQPLNKLEEPSDENTKSYIQLIDPQDLLKKEFICPKCGSHWFRSYQDRNTDVLHYHCNGEYGSCNFKWEEPDNEKYFHLKKEYRE